jgi:hypothetical protein
MKISIKLITLLGIILPAELLAQAQLENLFFSPVPIGMADDSILADARTDQERSDRESAEQLIASMQDQSGEFNEPFEQDPEQLQRLNRLGLAYQTLDRHQEALAIFADATSLAAEIYGEDALQQIPSLEQSILSHLQLNEVTSVTEKEEFIYAIKASNYAADSNEMFSAMINLTDWYTSAYFKINFLGEGRRQSIRSNAVQRVERQVGIDADGPGTLQSIANGSIRDVNVNDIIDARLQKMDDLYKAYQESYTSNTTLSTVLEVARRIARLGYHTKQEMDFEQVSNTFDPNYTGSREEQMRNSQDRSDESYRSGKDALQYIANLLADIEDVSAQQKSISMLDLADWELAYGRTESARQFYQVVYQLLLDDGFNVPSVDSALTPTIPVMIPRIAAFPATLQTSGQQGLSQNIDYKGYIDVSFGIDEFGNASNINFNSASEDAYSERIESILNTLLLMSKFRPILRGGEITAQAPVQYRYYYSY